VRQFKELKGICVRGCIAKDSMEEPAHAHSLWNDKHRGWICLRNKYILNEPLTLLHEVAHLIANSSPSIPWHGKNWKKTVKKIGGTFKAYIYKHRPHMMYLDFTHITHNPREPK
jgi:hypothetical protein